MLEVVYPALLTRLGPGLSRKPIKPPINVSCCEAVLYPIPGCGGWGGLPKKSRGLEGEVRVGVGGFILLPTVPYTTGSSSGLN